MEILPSDLAEANPASAGVFAPPQAAFSIRSGPSHLAFGPKMIQKGIKRHGS